jgi:hypothetical protein
LSAVGLLLRHRRTSLGTFTRTLRLPSTST